MSTKLKIRKLADWDALFCCYPQQMQQQDCYIQLDCKNGLLCAEYNAEIGNAIPLSVYHGHDRRYGIPCLLADAANALMDEIAPLAQRVLNGYDSWWNGSNMVAEFSTDAQAAEEEIEKIIESETVDESNCVSGVEAGDWLVPSVLTTLTADTTDEELDRLAVTLKVDAAENNMVLRGVVERLTEERQKMRDNRADE